ncbi:hydrogenase maturation nickel metallochaperone HypA [Helicobacter sp. 12S02634-8]|uniref:hydrogenase/urease nickel incorporation protein HypA n=1 Tax=Helicobacter sp. 12S02634-8 TaxID=1476199 RepID=UPI000BA524FB|nr:hydrogenase/urease nickel incorporation protein HypA [Helicobacter sp. 12S02634-8]PAF48491.1 hydrogenase maturation nickel metallochaperone HypA [Helicobacter sp. 12S02634-8]
MHEYSVVSSLLQLCEEHVHKNNASRVEKIVVGIGERSGMDKSLFISAFETFREESPVCKDAILEIIEEKVELECKDCHTRFSPQGIEYGICPECKGSHIEIIKGRQMHLLTLEMIGDDGSDGDEGNGEEGDGR